MLETFSRFSSTTECTTLRQVMSSSRILKWLHCRRLQSALLREKYDPVYFTLAEILCLFLLLNMYRSVKLVHVYEALKSGAAAFKMTLGPKLLSQEMPYIALVFISYCIVLASTIICSPVIVSTFT